MLGATGNKIVVQVGIDDAEIGNTRVRGMSRCGLRDDLRASDLSDIRKTVGSLFFEDLTMISARGAFDLMDRKGEGGSVY